MHPALPPTTLVNRPKRPSRSATARDACLVEREKERALLETALADGTRVVTICGEAGIGKSRLLEDVCHAESLNHLPMLTAACQPHSASFFLSPIVEALTGARWLVRRIAANLTPNAGALRPLVPELADLLPEQPEVTGDFRTDQHQVFRAVRETLSCLGDLILVLEDVHWADEASVALLATIAASPPDRLRLVMTFRQEDLVPDSHLWPLIAAPWRSGAHLRIELEPLTIDGVGRLASNLLPGRVSTSLATFLHQRTDGLPFAVEELLRTLRDRDGLVTKPDGWALRQLSCADVPAAIRDSTTHRLGRLPHAARRVAEATAVAYPNSSVPVIRDITDVPDFPAALDEALVSGLLVECEGRLAYRHELLRQAAYDALLGGERRELHRRAAERLTRTRAPLAFLAHHWREADCAVDWLEVGERAADEAMNALDSSGAARLLGDLLESLPPATPDAVRLARKLGPAALDRAGDGRAIRLLADVLGVAALDPAVEGELRFWRGLLLSRAGHHTESRSELSRAVELLPPVSSMTARARVWLGVPMTLEGSVSEHLTSCEAALHIAAGLGDERSRTVFWNAAAIRIALGQPGAVESLESLPGFPDSPLGARLHSRSCANVAEGAAYAGWLHVAREYETRAATDQARFSFDDGPEAADLLTVQLYRELVAGRWAALRGRLDRLMDSPTTPHLAVVAGIANQLLLLAAEGIRASTDLGDLSARALEIGLIPVAGTAVGWLGRELLGAQRPGDALAAVTPVFDVIVRKSAWAWCADVLPVVVAASWQLEDVRHARVAFETAEAHIAQLDAPAAKAGLLSCAPIITTGGDPAVRWRLAADAWTICGRSYDQAHALEMSARLATDPEAGRASAQAASALFAKVGAARDASRVRRFLRGEERPSSRSVGASLSARELQVAQFVIAGLTNRQIADELFLSTRTVEHHVERVLRKVGASSRRQMHAGLLAVPGDGVNGAPAAGMGSTTPSRTVTAPGMLGADEIATASRNQGQQAEC